MADRPSVLPLIDRLATNVIDWSLSPLQYTGFAANQVVPSAEHNTLWLLGALWQGYLDYGTLRLGDYVDASVAQRWSSTRLAYTLGQEIDVVGASPSSFVVYYVDGFRVEVDTGMLALAGAAPLLVPGATLPGRVWVYLDYGTIADPGQPIAAVRVESAGVGAAAAPGVGELPLVGVDVDVSGKVTGNTYDGGAPSYLLRYSDTISVELPALVTATQLVCGGSTLGDAPLTVNPVTVGSANSVAVIGDGTVAAMRVQGLGGIGVYSSSTGAHGIQGTTSLATSYGVRGEGNAGPGVGGESTSGTGVLGVSSSSYGVRGVSTSGDGCRGEGGGSGAGVVGVGGSSGIGVQGTGGAAGGAGVQGTSSAAGVAGVRGSGSAGAASPGVLGLAVEVGSYGLEGQSAALGTSAGAGVRALGQKNASALSCLADAGYAAVLTSKLTTPTKAALKLTGQDTDPSSPEAGDVLYQTARDKLRFRTSAAYQSVHSTPKGFVKAFAAGTAGAVVNSGDLATVTIVPEQTGDVLITATGLCEQAGDADSYSVLLRDVTLGTTIQTTIERQIDTDAAAVRTRSFVARAVYTLPSAASRQFAFRIEGNGGVVVTRSACVLSVEGVQ